MKRELIELLEGNERQAYAWMNRTIRKTHKVWSGDKWKLWHPRKRAMPLLLVAHVDTVGQKPPLVQEKSGKLYSGNGTVLGGDDRAGVYIVGQIVSRMTGRLPYVLLCDEEERGMIGAYSFAKSGLLEALKVNIYVEYDRRGINEYVHYLQPQGHVLPKILEEYGYVKAWGSYSDVKALSSKTGIAHVNLSTGYFDQHSRHETISLAGIDFAISTGLNMLPNLCRKKHNCTRERGGSLSKWSGDNWWKNGNGKKKYGKQKARDDYAAERGDWKYDTKAGEYRWENDTPVPITWTRCTTCNGLIYPSDHGICPMCQPEGLLARETKKEKRRAYRQCHHCKEWAEDMEQGLDPIICPSCWALGREVPSLAEKKQ
jgi:hypothetical protein